MTYPPAPIRRGRRRRRVLTALLLMVTVAFGCAYWLLRSEPTHWRAHQQFLREYSQAQRDKLAREAEAAIADALHADLSSELRDQLAQVGLTLTDLVEPGSNLTPEQLALQRSLSQALADVPVDERTTVHLTNPQLAALIEARLDDWMADRGYVRPDAIQQPMAVVRNGETILAFRLVAAGYDQVLTGRFDLTFQPDGMAVLKLRRFEAGRLPVPVNSITAHLAGQMVSADKARQIGDWLSKLERFEFKPVLELAHRRRARIEGIHVRADGLDVKLRIQDHATYRNVNEQLAGVDVP